jgi:hypothetical protein
MTSEEKARAKLAQVYMSIEHDARRPCSVDEAATFAACNRDIVEAFLREQGTADNHSVTIDPHSKLGILTKDFMDTVAILTRLGYACTSASKADDTAQFTRANSASFLVKQDGSWSAPDMASKEVSSGVNAFQLQVLLGVTN